MAAYAWIFSDFSSCFAIIVVGCRNSVNEVVDTIHKLEKE